MPPLYVAAIPAELGDLPGEALGVGLVAASVTLARLLAERLPAARPSAVILVGTAGAFPGVAGPPIGSVIVGRRLGLGAAAVALGVGYQPCAPEPIYGDEALRGALVRGALAQGSVVEADVLTNLAITTSPSLAEHFGAEWQVEHMETFGAAYACRAAGVPFVCVLGITNLVGPNAHAEWRANRGASEAAARLAAQLGASFPAPTTS